MTSSRGWGVAHVRFGRGLAGCVVDCYTDASGAEWVPLSQARDAANRQVKRLAEEVDRLKRENELTADIHAKDEQEYASGEEEGIVGERTRIRRELMEAFGPYALRSDEWIATAEGFVDVLDRICPEEG